MRDMKCGKRKATLIGSLIPSGAQSTRSFSWFVFAAPALFFNPWFLVIIALKGVISEGNQMRKSLGCYIFIRLGMDGFFFCAIFMYENEAGIHGLHSLLLMFWKTIVTTVRI